MTKHPRHQTQDRCTKPAEDRCPGCRRLAFWQDKFTVGSATTVRIVRPVAANTPRRDDPFDL